MSRTKAGIRTLVALGAVLAVTACGGETGAAPQAPSYDAPDPATATAQVVDLEGALAVAPAGSRLAVVQEGKFCIRDRVPTGAKGTLGTCADDPDLADDRPAVFSPSGSKVVVFDSPGSYSGTGRAWIVDATSGATTPITLPDASTDNSTSNSSSGSTAPTGSATSTADPGRPADAAVSYLWASDDALVAVGLSGTVYRISASGEGAVVAPTGERGQQAAVMAALGGNTVVMSLERPSGGGSRLVAVSLADGSVKDPVVDFGAKSGRPVLMGVSPDGTKVLASTTDLQRLLPGETAIYDIASGQRTPIAGTARTFAAAGAFSPDGSLIAVVASAPVPEGETGVGTMGGFDLQLAPADGATAPRSVADSDASNLYGPLTWNAAGWITSSPPIPRPYAWTVG